MAIWATLGLLAAACSGGSVHAGGHGKVGVRPATADTDLRLSITPLSGTTDATPDRGITVSADGGRISGVVVRTRGDRVTGSLNATTTVWHSTWALDVSQHYTVIATAVGAAGGRVTRSVSFRTFTPRQTFTAEIINPERAVSADRRPVPPVSGCGLVRGEVLAGDWVSVGRFGGAAGGCWAMCGRR